jgi:monofunctional glycosyltransferase
VLRRVALGCLASFSAAALYVLWLPDVRPLKKSNPATTAYIELRARQAARDKKPFAKKMVWTRWADISENLKHAVMIAEDDNFYGHSGVDWEGVKLALARDWETKSLGFGGSTITQQLAKNLYLSPSRNPLRKLKELLIAYRLERELGKRRIFELYLNVAEWGKGIYGVGAAAQAYFGKSPAELTVEESAALAAVLPNPRRWNPASTSSKYVARNSARIMNRMRASGFLTEEQEEEEDLEEEFGVEASTPIVLSTETLPVAGLPEIPAVELPSR